MAINIMPRNIKEDKKTKAVTIRGLQSYKDAKFTFATARGIISSMKMMPFIIGSISTCRSIKNAIAGSRTNLDAKTQTTSFLLTSLIFVPYM